MQVSLCDYGRRSLIWKRRISLQPQCGFVSFLSPRDIGKRKPLKKSIFFSKYQRLPREEVFFICTDLCLHEFLPNSIDSYYHDSVWKQHLDYEKVPFRCRHCHQYKHLIRDWSMNKNICVKKTFLKQSQLFWKNPLKKQKFESSQYLKSRSDPWI